MAVTYAPIATTTLGSSQNSITFNSIPGTYTDLYIVLNAKWITATATPMIRFNSDATTTYSYTYLLGDGTTAAISSTSTSNTQIAVGNTGSTAQPSFCGINIFSYAGSTFKSVLANHAQDLNGSGSTWSSVGMWRSTSAITSVTIYASLSTGNFATGTTATLYGIKAA